MPGILNRNLHRNSNAGREDRDGNVNVVRNSNGNFVRADNDNVNRDGSANGGPVNGIVAPTVNGHLNVNGGGTNSSCKYLLTASRYHEY
jgi:hypothetical protein